MQCCILEFYTKLHINRLLISFVGTVEEAVVKSLRVHKQLASLGEDKVVYIAQVHQPGSHPPTTQKSMYVMSV